MCIRDSRWCDLRVTPPQERRLALVLANYPTRNARLANGVGLDTPSSAAAMLAWLRDAGYSLGAEIPGDGDALIAALLASRTNDPESSHLKAADHLSLQVYLEWYSALPSATREGLEAQWGTPQQDPSLERDGFPIHGLRFGNAVVMIQPSLSLIHISEPTRPY